MRNFPKIMGILNVTPDSFSDGGLFFDSSVAISYSLEMLSEGADIIDIGGESSRPGAESITTEEELKRVIHVIEGIKKSNEKVEISIDTTKYEVAEAAISAGATYINDISGLEFESRLASLAAKYDCTLILMHMQGKPRTMQQNPVYNNVVQEVFDELKKKIKLARKAGVNNIIADVGIGFGKTVEHNLELLRNHNKFSELGVPMLLGLSRKSFIGKTLEIENPQDRDIPTALLHALLLDSEIDIIRVHNVKMMAMLKKLYNLIKE